MHERKAFWKVRTGSLSFQGWGDGSGGHVGFLMSTTDWRAHTVNTRMFPLLTDREAPRGTLFLSFRTFPPPHLARVLHSFLCMAEAGERGGSNNLNVNGKPPTSPAAWQVMREVLEESGVSIDPPSLLCYMAPALDPRAAPRKQQMM